VHLARSDLELAQSYHQHALDLARDIDSPWDQAQALAGMGRCAQAAGLAADAERSLRRALKILQDAGTAEARIIASELDALTAARTN
jgi:Tfp pilus assembly protein PilF